jgi:hypothetical protein
MAFAEYVVSCSLALAETKIHYNNYFFAPLGTLPPTNPVWNNIYVSVQPAQYLGAVGEISRCV